MNDRLDVAVREAVEAAVMSPTSPTDGARLLHQVAARQARTRASRPRRAVLVGLAAAAVAGVGVGAAALLPERTARPRPGLVVGTAPLPSDAVVVGTARVTGALIDPANPRRLIVSVDGSGPVPQNSLCWEGYRATATETGGDVAVRVDRLHHRPGAGPGVACAGTGATIDLSVTINNPVGSRPVRNVPDGTRLRPFDGALLLRPTYLPPGYREVSAPGVGADGTWLRFYDKPGPGPFTVKQQFGTVAGPPEPDAVVESRTAVGGAPATVYAVTSPAGVERRTVVWTVDAQTVTVDASLPGPARPPLTAAELLRIASGLRPAD